MSTSRFAKGFGLWHSWRVGKRRYALGTLQDTETPELRYIFLDGEGCFYELPRALAAEVWKLLQDHREAEKKRLRETVWKE